MHLNLYQRRNSISPNYCDNDLGNIYTTTNATKHTKNAKIRGNFQMQKTKGKANEIDQ